jgi:hypothetical protein
MDDLMTKQRLFLDRQSFAPRQGDMPVQANREQ